MNRDLMVTAARDGRTWDVVIIGGGATGLGTAVEAASRGHDTLLLEAGDFSQGTSSRSTKLVHGGVRYLQQGDVSLVLEALRERGLLLHNAPHLVHHLSFVVPNYDWWEGPFYGVGLKLYDMLAGRLGLGPSEHLSRDETLERIPTIEPEGPRGGVIYYDAQFDDSRLAITLARTAESHGATLINYAPVTGLLKEDGLVRGVTARDEETGETFEISARVVVNATGVFTDLVRQLDEPGATPIVSASQGVHIVLDRSFLPGTSAIMVPHTDDGRVLFAVPWHDRVIVGTTDTQMDDISLEPRPLEEELEFLLTHAVRYLTKDPDRSDILSVFAGLRPLVSPDGHEEGTASISRDHTLLVSCSGLVTISGGKWTTYRKMGEDTIDRATMVGGLDERSSLTEDLHLHGWRQGVDPSDPLSVYGSEVEDLLAMCAADETRRLSERLHPKLPYLRGEIVWAARNEMARTVDDALARRTRALLLDARSASEAANDAARLMAEELGHDETWIETQTATFHETAIGYLP